MVGSDLDARDIHEERDDRLVWMRAESRPHFRIAASKAPQDRPDQLNGANNLFLSGQMPHAKSERRPRLLLSQPNAA